MDDYTATVAPADFRGVARTLDGTRPWVRLMSVLMFIGVAFMALFGLIAGVAGAARGDASIVGLLIIYPLMGLLYLFPAIFLWRYADGINAFMGAQNLTNLESALDAQRSFWKFTGIMVIVSFAVGVLGAIAVGAFAAAFMGR